jgi:hypothetical protein
MKRMNLVTSFRVLITIRIPDARIIIESVKISNPGSPGSRGCYK